MNDDLRLAGKGMVDKGQHLQVILDWCEAMGITLTMQGEFLCVEPSGDEYADMGQYSDLLDRFGIGPGPIDLGHGWKLTEPISPEMSLVKLRKAIIDIRKSHQAGPLVAYVTPAGLHEIREAMLRQFQVIEDSGPLDKLSYYGVAIRSSIAVGDGEIVVMEGGTWPRGLTRTTYR